jgi:hypothetical protein
VENLDIGAINVNASSVNDSINILAITESNYIYYYGD